MRSLAGPALGAKAFVGYRYSFSETYKPPAERLFGGEDIVMVPKANITDPVQFGAMLAAYLPDIRRMFTLAWNPPNGGCTAATADPTSSAD